MSHLLVLYGSFKYQNTLPYNTYDLVVHTTKGLHHKMGWNIHLSQYTYTNIAITDLHANLGDYGEELSSNGRE